MTIHNRTLLEELRPQATVPPLGALLWRARFRVLLAAVAGAVAAGLWSLFLAQPLYTATTRLALTESSAPAASLDVASVMPRLSPSVTRLNSAAAALRDPALLVRLANDIPPVPAPPAPLLDTLRTLPAIQWLEGHSPFLQARNARSPHARHAATLAQQIIIRPLPDSSVLEISVLDPTPQRAMQVANRLARLHLNESATAQNSRAAAHATWIAERRAAAEDTHKLATSTAEQFTTAHDLLAPDPRPALLDRRRALSESHATLAPDSPRAQRLADEITDIDTQVAAETTARLHWQQLRMQVTQASETIAYLRLRALTQAESALIAPPPIYQIAPALLPVTPTAPRPAVAIALGGFLASLAAAALAILFPPRPQRRQGADKPPKPHSAPWQDKP
ncbi:Wzz/FepE/Etk N-terminal domain-containing protein [Pelagovum sp. HNIBRBA483]|uniref:Wzz/FepE/Etk N-terminal domain-containing protein n=1 Tax=Pelagovum sp. HNIBRBA483 TaxID=3233341 RepID=UPI0034A375B2